MKTIAILVLLLGTSAASADSRLEQAIQAGTSGDHRTALPLWEELGAGGDRKAMVEAGLIYHQGLGRPVDHDRALDWYLASMVGAALNNVGVMFRDGTGVPLNRKVAYLLFLTIHMTGAGNEETVMRANRNLRREIAELPRLEIREALCYSVDYLLAYVQSRGHLQGIPEDLRAAEGRPRIKELDWWMQGEVEPYECPHGT